jgi:hypothetical protein
MLMRAQDTALVRAGTIPNFEGILKSIVDAFTSHAASALAAASYLRSLAELGLSPFAPAMYAALGYGKGDTVLAALAVVIGCPALFVLWKLGTRIHAVDRFAELQVAGT